MSKVNFVPDDYVQNSESRRTNMMYIGLFVLLMAVLGSIFATIKEGTIMNKISANEININIFGSFPKLIAIFKVIIY